MSGTELYIETWVDADVEDLWGATQEPDQHERWDLRFTDIDYLPRPDESEPQQFDYETRIGFGIGVAGGGESTGERADGGERTSALRFWSDDPKSLITEGNGYWKYLPEDGGVRFLTAYNYDTRFGRLGSVFDRFVFRPLMVWATAWSFDRLRLWLESDVSPEASMRQAIVHAVARLSLAVVWVYQGLVPKLLGPHPVERELSAALLPAGLPVDGTIQALGAAEVGFGLLLLVAWHRRLAFPASALLTVALVGAGLVANPGLLAHPLSSIPLGVAMLGLAAVGYAAGEELPSARRCITDRTESDLQ
ncbi:DoxX-like family protein [Halomicrobium zhouii]|uniref:DoxX-like family protein n=1 Tax=Halomicrobium zhouii TaxID=767519 RepID=A0A1I6LCT8_9EURY|nr:DoxX-like family protein [Halomicrobium zhouii]SFS01234.1 DoxX-like family protein [Halomicrobium zhouii]